MPETNFISYCGINYCREYQIQNQKPVNPGATQVFEHRFTGLISPFVKWG